MEYWKLIEDVTIPKDTYQATFDFESPKGSNCSKIYLKGTHHQIGINIINYYFRILDRKLLYSQRLLNQEEVKKYGLNNFQEVIYEVNNSRRVLELEPNSVWLLHKETQKYFIVIVDNIIIELISMDGEIDIEIE